LKPKRPRCCVAFYLCHKYLFLLILFASLLGEIQMCGFPGKLPRRLSATADRWSDAWIRVVTFCTKSLKKSNFQERIS
jgi:hypothetical protein